MHEKKKKGEAGFMDTEELSEALSALQRADEACRKKYALLNYKYTALHKAYKKQSDLIRKLLRIAKEIKCAAVKDAINGYYNSMSAGKTAMKEAQND